MEETPGRATEEGFLSQDRHNQRQYENIALVSSPLTSSLETCKETCTYGDITLAFIWHARQLNSKMVGWTPEAMS